MIDPFEIMTIHDIDYIYFLSTGLKYGFIIGFTVVFIALGIKYSLKLFAKS